MKVELTNATIAKVAIQHLQDCGRRFPNLGSLQSLRAPQRGQLINATTPKIADAEKRMSIQADGSGNPQAAVKLDYNPKRELSGGAIRTARGVTSGEATTDVITATYAFDVHREYTKQFTAYDLVKLSAETEAYLKALNAGNVSFAQEDLPNLAYIGEQVLTEIEGILTPINTLAAAAYTASVGVNLATGDALSPDIDLYNTDGSMRTDLFDFFNAIRRKHNYSGTLIVVGGDKCAAYMEKRGIFALNLIGLQQDVMMNTMNVAFFYDAQIDVTLGMDEIIISEPNAACFQTILEHQYMIKQKKVASTSYGKMALNLAQYNAASFLLEMDLRVKETDGPWPTFDVTPSIHGGFVFRPAGYFADYGGWEEVTGVWRAKLV